MTGVCFTVCVYSILYGLCDNRKSLITIMQPNITIVLCMHEITEKLQTIHSLTHHVPTKCVSLL